MLTHQKITKFTDLQEMIFKTFKTIIFDMANVKKIEYKDEDGDEIVIDKDRDILNAYQNLEGTRKLEIKVTLKDNFIPP